MERPDKEAIDTFISITGVSELDAIQTLEEHLGNLNEAVNTHFGGRDRNIHDASVSSSRDDLTDIDDTFLLAPYKTPFSLLPSARNTNPSSLLDPNSTRSEFYTVHNEDIRTASFAHGKKVLGSSSSGIDDLPEYSNDIEEEMIRAAIEASKQDAEIGYSNQNDPMPLQMHSHLEDADLARAFSFSLKTAKQEKATRKLAGEVGPSYKSAEVEDLGKLASPNGRQCRFEPGSSSVQDEHEDVEERLLIRHRSRQVLPGSVHTAKEIGKSEFSLPSTPRQPIDHLQCNKCDFCSDEWGGISCKEHDEAVIFEAALFGGIPESNEYHLPYATHQLMQNGLDRTMGPSPRLIPCPPSPSLTAQCLTREHQDDEYLASLQADREKELKAREEAEIHSVEGKVAREAALAEDRQKEVELHKKLEEEQEIEATRGKRSLSS